MSDSSLEPRLEHQTVKVRQLVEDYRNGRIVIPEFQRDYVWKKNKAPRLIDSLYRGYPISSLLLWTSDEQTRSRRAEPRPSRAASVSWLIDGQQRVITLARTVGGDQDIDVLFNPEADVFRLASAAFRWPDWVRVSDLWDDEFFRRLQRNSDGSRHADRREAAFEKVRRILDYEVPLVRMVNHSFENAVSAFERINTLGVKLKKEDIESAHIAARHSGFIADEVVPFLLELRQQGFNRLNIMHLFRACTFVAKPDGRNRTPLHELEKQVVLSAWRKTQQATQQAVNLVRSELGLVNMNILWSGALLVPLIALCATLSPRQRDARGMIGWLALAALLHRYSRSSETALDQDLRACKESDPIGALLKNLRQIRPVLSAIASDFAGGLADKSGLLAMYIACYQQGILDFYSGAKVIMQPDVDRHHILPRSQFPIEDRAAADIVANIAFVVGDVNKSIGQTGPEVYLKRLDSRVLKSQCMPTDSALWSIDQADEFWQQRRELLADSFNAFIKDSFPGRRLVGA
jgi:hypothetical protein